MRIEELPLQMLIVLLETPGEVVSKEVLRSRLWSDRIFGELDNGLHVAAAKLREALGQKTGATQYIETIRRRGYRFNGHVEPIFSSVAETPALPLPSDNSTPPPVLPESLLTSLPPAPIQPVSRRPRLLTLGLASLAALLVLAALALFFYRRRTPLLGASDQVVLGGFTNASGDDSYNGLGHAFRVKLEESPYLNLISDQNLLRLVPEPASASLQQLEQGCLSLGGKVLITGTIASHGQGFEVATAARNCATGRLLAKQSVLAAKREAVITALDQATDQLRKSLGEPSASLQRFNVPLAQATTSSLAALRAFTLGEQKRDAGQEFDAIRDYKLAVDLDPNFALAYARLGTIYSNAAERTQSAAYYQKAFDLRERTTDRERLYIAAHYYSISGQTERTIEAYELWRSLYPRDSSPNENLAIEYIDMGHPERALIPARAAAQLDAGSSISLAILARVYLETGQHAELRSLCADASDSKKSSAMLHASCFLLAFLQNDETAMEAQIHSVRGNADASELLDDVAWVAMYQGKLSSGRKLFAQARQAAMAQGFSELAATVDVDQATLEAEFGYSHQARALAIDALRLAPDDVRIQALAALALARSGDASLAESTVSKASSQAPLDTILNKAEIPAIRAAILLQKHDPLAAIQALEAARPYDQCSVLALAPAYYRGLAYTAAGQPEKAAAEYRNLIEHHNLVPDSPYVPMAHLQLSRALRRMGDTQGAAQAEHQLKEAWRHADSDFLPLHQQ